MTAGAHTHHAQEDVCEAGLQLYARALREGSVSAREAAALPCTTEAGLLRPDPDDSPHADDSLHADVSPDTDASPHADDSPHADHTRRLRPVTPALALPRLLRRIAEDIAERRRAETHLTEAFAPLMALSAGPDGSTTPLSGFDEIDEAISAAMDEATDEVLAVQPYTGRPVTSTLAALPRDQALLDRGGRIRTLYPHTLRHSPLISARYEQLCGDAEARTLDEVTDRLIVIDRTIAFIPASPDRSLALKIRHPAIVRFLATGFDRLWRLATPMYPEAVQPPTRGGVTPRQRAIAALLVEGHTDAVIAERLGMNVRTAREHIAKLAATLGSESRAQLGYLIGRSGILDAGA